MESDILISWKAPEYEHIAKTTDWYWAIGILTIGIIIVGILIKNMLFVIFALLAGFSIALYSARPPNMASFSVNARGVKIDKKLFLYEDLDSFWIHYDPPHKKEIGIISKKTFVPRIIMPLADTDPNDVRAHLIKFLEEKHNDEDFSEILSRYIGF